MARVVVQCPICGFLMLSSQFANARILGQGATLPPSAISAFQANPSQLLSRFPNGSPEMAEQVRDLLGSDKVTFPAIIAFSKSANEDQRKAITQGLVDSAKAYAKDDPAFVNQIQLAVANAGFPEFAKAYAEAAGDTGTASTGGGAGGGGGPNVAGARTAGLNGGGISSGNQACRDDRGWFAGLRIVGSSGEYVLRRLQQRCHQLKFGNRNASIRVGQAESDLSRMLTVASSGSRRLEVLAWTRL